MKRSWRPLLLAFVVGLLPVFFLGYLYYRNIPGSLSSDPTDWGTFGDYLGGLLNPLYALINLIVVAYIAFRIDALQAERQAHTRDSERRANAVKLLDTVYSNHFLKEVTPLVWEISVKWRYWKGSEGNKYRWDVVSGFVSFSSHYRGFTTPNQMVTSGHNIIRFGDHYHPADYNQSLSSPYVQTVLSEHQALNWWLEFWGNINTMIEEDLVDSKTVQKLFGDWYGYWLDFIIELRWIVGALHTEKADKMKNAGLTALPEPKPRWIDELIDLEKKFYVVKTGIKHGFEEGEYERRSAECIKRANDRLAELREFSERERRVTPSK